jgi:hypothetical protein
MRSGLAMFCALTAACGFQSPTKSDTPDSSDAPADCKSFAAQLDTCGLQLAFPLNLSGMLTFDTDTGVLTDAANIETPVSSMLVSTLGAEVRALIATTVVLMPNTTLRAQGSRGLAIIARDVVILGQDAVINVSQGGAGHRGDCGDQGATSGAPDAGGGAGGGGGGFGGAGGDGSNGNNTTSAGGRGGAKVAEPPAGPLGGCAGASGGKEAGTENDGGAGGLGGGSIYLVSAVSITIHPGAGISAGGAGGAGGEHESGDGDAGGGGGGSGGSIFLEAPMLRVHGILAANGGGGGEGSGGTLAGQAGTAGPYGVMQAPGGALGSLTGADGGPGGFFMSPAGGKPAPAALGGGGGGGGGVGVIRITAPEQQLSVNLSPTPS